MLLINFSIFSYKPVKFQSSSSLAPSSSLQSLPANIKALVALGVDPQDFFVASLRFPLSSSAIFLIKRVGIIEELFYSLSIILTLFRFIQILAFLRGKFVRLLSNPICHSEPFASCHSERSEESHGAQDRLREESRPFAIAQGDRISNRDKLFLFLFVFQYNRHQVDVY